MSVLTITQIVSEFGQYYVKEGQNRSRLIRSLQQMPETLEKYARHIRTTETVYRMANYRHGSVLQPFTTTFNPVSEIEFIPNEIKLQKIKVNARFTPDEIEDSWLGFMSGNTTRNKKDWPIVRFLMEEYLAKQIGVDREELMVYKGVRNDAGTTPSACMDGIRKQLIDGVNKSEYPINVIHGIGALDEDSIFDQIEKFDETLPSLYRTQPVIIFVSPKWFRAFMKDRRAQTFYQLRNENDLDTAIDFTGGRHRLVALPSMEGTNDLWATVPDNLLWLTIRDMSTASADMQAIHYDVDVMLDWWEGIGFSCNQMVWTTAETVSMPSSEDTANPADGIAPKQLQFILGGAKNIENGGGTLECRIKGDITESEAENMSVTFEIEAEEEGGGKTGGTKASNVPKDGASVTAERSESDPELWTADFSNLTAGQKLWHVEAEIGTDLHKSANGFFVMPELT